MTEEYASARDRALAVEALAAIQDESAYLSGVTITVGKRTAKLPRSATAALDIMLRILSRGASLVLTPDVIEAADRPRCATCDEPVVLAAEDDPESWVHAPDANDAGDHTAWVE